MCKYLLLLLACFLSVIYGINGLSKTYPINSDRQLSLTKGDVQEIGLIHNFSNDVTISDENEIYHRTDPKNTFVTANGIPIIYRVMLGDGSVFSGMSKRLKYVIKNGILTLGGDAFIRNNSNPLSAARIYYNIKTNKVVASSQLGLRVSYILTQGNNECSLSARICTRIE